MRKQLNFFLVLLSLCLSGCLLPEAPDFSSYNYVDVNRGNFTVYHTHNENEKRRNLIFLARDEQAQHHFAPQLKQMYGSDNPPRLEELVWWQFSPALFEKYGQVLVIPYHETKYKNLEAALEYMEAQGTPYDLFLFSYGIPNHLTDGREGYFLSWQELQDWEGKWLNLDLVFMQACFGTTLVGDWHRAGADSVISFKGFHRNFFYPAIFLEWYQELPVAKAHQNTVRAMRWTMERKPLYKMLVEKGFGMTLDEYFEAVDSPQLTMLNPPQGAEWSLWRPTEEGESR